MADAVVLLAALVLVAAVLAGLTFAVLRATNQGAQDDATPGARRRPEDAGQTARVRRVLMQCAGVTRMRRWGGGRGGSAALMRCTSLMGHHRALAARAARGQTACVRGGFASGVRRQRPQQPTPQAKAALAMVAAAAPTTATR
jgi:hypothetical protein